MKNRAFTLIEILVGTAVFLVISVGAYNAYLGLFKIIDLGQYRLLAVNLANEQFEIARNLPYASVGIVGGIPNGVIPGVQVLERGGVMFTVESIVRNIDLAFDGTLGGSPNDTSPADNKLIEVTISCSGCREMQPIKLSGQIAPKSLETASTNGALLVRVFDANGQPVQGADVHVVNVATTTTIVIDDVTDANGILQLVDLPPGVNAYRVTVSKPGYSTDRTYPPGGAGNPTPHKQDATVVLQQTTQVSFAIDLIGQLSISSVGPTCSAIGGFDFRLTGAKQIGTDVPKYSQSLATNGSGVLSLSSMEWDQYTVVPLDATYSLAGLIPLNPSVLNPGASGNLKLVAVPNEPRMLLVTVKDQSTGLPLASTTVTLSKTGWDEELITGKGHLTQTDWSGDSGQAVYSDPTGYWSDDNNVDADGTPGELKLKEAFGTYNPSGILESSTMDSGSPSSFFNLSWNPGDAPVLAGPNAVRFQIASNSTDPATTTWDFKGPNGTAATYYTIPNSPIHSSHNGDRYFRYRVYLSTEDQSVSPNISDVSMTYTASCTPPGQVIFKDLTDDTYTLTVSKDGYTTSVQDIPMDLNWQSYEVLMVQ